MNETTYINKVGIRLDKPNIIILWKYKKPDIIKLFSNNVLKKLSDFDYVTNVTLFENKFECLLSILFDSGGSITKLSLINDTKHITSDEELLNLFRNTQEILEDYLGKPTIIPTIISNLFKSSKYEQEYKWYVNNNIFITHSLWDRFGLEEHIEVHIS